MELEDGVREAGDVQEICRLTLKANRAGSAAAGLHRLMQVQRDQLHLGLDHRARVPCRRRSTLRL